MFRSKRGMDEGLRFSSDFDTNSSLNIVSSHEEIMSDVVKLCPDLELNISDVRSHNLKYDKLLIVKGNLESDNVTTEDVITLLRFIRLCANSYK